MFRRKKKNKKEEKSEKINLQEIKSDISSLFEHVSPMTQNKKDENSESEENQNIEIKKERDNYLIEWESPEYEFIYKSSSWYWITLIIAIILITFSLWQKNFLFAIFVFITELIVLYFGSQIPKIWGFYISENGIGIKSGKFYNYKDLSIFDIHQSSDDFSELVFKTKEKISPYQKILIHNEDIEIIEEELLKHIKKQEIEPSFVDVLEKLIKF